MLLLWAGPLFTVESEVEAASSEPTFFQVLDVLKYKIIVTSGEKSMKGWGMSSLVQDLVEKLRGPRSGAMTSWLEAVEQAAGAAGLFDKSPWQLVSGKITAGIDSPREGEVQVPAVILAIPVNKSPVEIFEQVLGKVQVAAPGRTKVIDLNDAQALLIWFHDDEPVPMVLFTDASTLYVSTSVERIREFIETRRGQNPGASGSPGSGLGDREGRIRVRPMSLGLQTLPAANGTKVALDDKSPFRQMLNRWLSSGNEDSAIDVTWSAGDDFVHLLAEEVESGAPGVRRSQPPAGSGFRLHETLPGDVGFFLGIDVGVLTDPELPRVQVWGSLLAEYLKLRLGGEMHLDPPDALAPLLKGSVAMLRWHGGDAGHQGAIVLDAPDRSHAETLIEAIVSSLEGSGSVVQKTEFERLEIRSAVSVDGTGDWLPSLTIHENSFLISSDESLLKALIVARTTLSEDEGVRRVVGSLGRARLSCLFRLDKAGIEELFGETDAWAGIQSISMGVGLYQRGRLGLSVWVGKS